MALTKTSVSVLGPVSVPAGTTKTTLSTAGTGAAVDCRAYYGGELNWRLTNGSAPATPPVLTIQVSADGANWFDYYSVGGDVTGNSINSGSVVLDRGVMYVRAIVYNHQTNAVTAEVNLQAVASL